MDWHSDVTQETVCRKILFNSELVTACNDLSKTCEGSNHVTQITSSTQRLPLYASPPACAIHQQLGCGRRGWRMIGRERQNHVVTEKGHA